MLAHVRLLDREAVVALSGLAVTVVLDCIYYPDCLLCVSRRPDNTRPTTFPFIFPADRFSPRERRCIARRYRDNAAKISSAYNISASRGAKYSTTIDDDAEQRSARDR